MKRIFFISLLLALSSCGDAIEICNDNNKVFPDSLDFPKNVEIIDRIKTDITGIMLTKYEQLPEEEKLDRNVLQYASDTSLKNTAKLGSVKYLKLFDGVISCAGETANSRLHLYQSGIYVDLNKRLLTADRVGAYMTSSSKNLKMEGMITLYKLVNASTKKFIAYDYTFETVLPPNTTAPYFYSFKLSEISAETPTLLKDVSMFGFSYKRLPLTQEEIDAGSYTPYITDETNSSSFVKLYDLSMPNSTWH